MTRFELVPPGETRPSLLVDVVDEVNASALRSLQERMIRAGCANALAVDAAQVHVLHDTYDTMDETAILDEAQIPTLTVLGAAPPEQALASQVEAWLRRLALHWVEVLPREPWAAVLLGDVVPAASGSTVQVIGR